MSGIRGSSVASQTWRGRLWLTPLVLAWLALDAVQAQEPLLQPGEAYVTRFSGTTAIQGQGAPLIVINPNGTVGSIIDLRNPGQPPQGQHWIDEPQRQPVTAGEIGQVFGVALDDAAPPNIFLTATAAFGLHRTPNNAQWMPGMWGPGGPGGVYVLDRNAGYRPRVLAQITLGGRPNSGAGLGNIAFDKYNKQLFVSDLETGMIHRLRAADGADGGFYDHGTQGRANFFDAENNQPSGLTPIAFDPESRARLTDCSSRFDTTPGCWNVAASGRRVWGVGVRRDPSKNEVRLYYAVWSGPSLGANEWNQGAEDDKRNSVWSVRLAPDGNFDPSDVRREFLVPDFFVKPEDIARAGFSQPVSDVTFPECGGRALMLIAERGGMRNLGLGQENPFADPHESRALRYELYQDGMWRPVGRYDVGFYNRQKEGEPFLHANCSGGVAFGYNYTTRWVANRDQPDQFAWITGDSLCSPDGPCNLPGGAQATAPGQPPAQPAAGQTPANAEPQQGPQGDDSEVHGVQGMPESAFDEVAPAAAFQPYPADGSDPTPAAGPSQAYLIDTDINVDRSGNLIPEELTRNDATKIGDIAIYQVCRQPVPPVALPPPPATLIDAEDGHPPDISHARYYSHGREFSHFRWASHWPAMSHHRYNSWHDRRGTLIHDLRRSREHNLWISVVHEVRPSWVHDRWRSIRHNERISLLHDQRRSAVHDLRASSEHDPRLSRLGHQPVGSHVVALSQARHVPAGSHLRVMSLRGHLRSQSRPATQQSHTPPGSHLAAQSRLRTHQPPGSHLAAQSQQQAHKPPGSHNAELSQRQTHRPPGSHLAAQSQQQAHKPPGSHSTVASRGPVHNAAASRGPSRPRVTPTVRPPRVTPTVRAPRVTPPRITRPAPPRPSPPPRRCRPGQRC